MDKVSTYRDLLGTLEKGSCNAGSADYSSPFSLTYEHNLTSSSKSETGKVMSLPSEEIF